MRKFTLLVVLSVVFVAGCSTEEEKAARKAEANRRKTAAETEEKKDKIAQARLEGSVAPANWEESVDQKIATNNKKQEEAVDQKIDKRVRPIEGSLVEANRKLDALILNFSEPKAPVPVPVPAVVPAPKKDVPLRDGELPADIVEKIAIREAEQKFELRMMEIAHKAEADEIQQWLRRFDTYHPRPNDNFIATRRAKMVELLTLEAEFKKDRAIKVAKQKTEIEDMKKP